MSERFEKTYISIHEFISSWQKEIYELNNLDYFTFLLINYVGYHIEHNFFTTKKQCTHLKIDPEEIATLSFNIGDSFESFLENNCFGDCTLSCPTKMNEKYNPDDLDINNSHIQILQIVNGTDLNKKQFLLTDILNYVVLDTLYDFYNYEIGLELDDADTGLMEFADFITVSLEKFIEQKGRSYLTCPKDTASELFEKLLHDSEDSWEDSMHVLDEEDNEDKDEWKYGDNLLSNQVKNYIFEWSQNSKSPIMVPKLLNYFQEYTDKYAGILRIDEITNEDLEEFFSFWLVREITLELNIDPLDVKEIFIKFFKWLELSKDFDLDIKIEEFWTTRFVNFNNAIVACREYFAKNSMIDAIIESNACKAQIIEGFFQVERIYKNGFIKLKDIHFKKEYLNVQMNLPKSILDQLVTESILDACLKTTAYGWRLVNLEYIFPQSAKSYLH